MLYTLIRKVFFSLDAEVAHGIGMSGVDFLNRAGVACLLAKPPAPNPVKVMGLTFPNPVGLAAGLDKNGEHIDALAALGFGSIEIGTVTPRPQPGNPKPRMFRIPEKNALINRLGFNNEGLDAFLANVRRSQVRAKGGPMLLGLNIGKNATTPIEEATSDYIKALDGVYPHADYVTVNISSPNTKNLRALQSDEALDALLDPLMRRRDALAAQHGRQVPLFVKIAPDLDDAQIDCIATTLRRHGMGSDGKPHGRLGVIATNTTIGREGVEGLAHATETGGLSGAPVRDKSNHVIASLRAALGEGFAIIGVGGILSGQDAVDKCRAGADVVQLYSGLIYRGPELVHEVAAALRAAR